MLIRLSVIFLAAAVLAGCGHSASNTAPPTPQPTEPSLRPPLAHSYAALGASETYGVGAVPHTRGYAYLVAKALHARPLTDTGIPGTTVDAGYELELVNALDSRPTLATVFFGVNDLRAGVTRSLFLDDMHDLVATLRQAKTQVIIIGVPDVSELPAVRRQHISGSGKIVSRWNAGLRRIGHETGAHYLNLDAFTRDLAAHSRYIASDGLHPSTVGHKRLAQVVLSAIRRWHLWRS